MIAIVRDYESIAEFRKYFEPSMGAHRYNQGKV